MAEQQWLASWSQEDRIKHAEQIVRPLRARVAMVERLELEQSAYYGHHHIGALLALLDASNAELVAGRAVIAAAEAYHAACKGAEAAYESEAEGWGDRMADATQAREEASDALRTAVAARQKGWSRV